MTAQNTMPLIFVLLICIVGCSSSGPARLTPLRNRIRPPDPKQYQQVTDASDWKNPKMIVMADGVEIVGVSPAGQTVPVDSVPAILERLPNSAWPYGLVVGINEAGLRGLDDTPRITANRKKLVAVLESLGIVVDMWPSG